MALLSRFHPLLLTGFALLAAGFSLTACEQVVDVPAPDHAPALSVRCVLTAGPSPDSAGKSFQAWRQLYVSHSRKLFDQTPLTGLATATARLYDASGAVVEEFRPGRRYDSSGPYSDTAGFYVPTRGFAPQAGGTYRLRVEAPGYDAVESTLTLPPAPVELSDAAFEPKPDNDMWQRRGRLKVNIHDDPATDDFYIATARFLDLQGQPVYYGNVYPDNSENDGNTEFEGTQLKLSYSYGGVDQTPYADYDVAGRVFTFSTNVSILSYDPMGDPLPGQIELVITRITNDLYKFLLSRQRYSDTEGNPFAEPAPLYSNVKPGFGIFGGAVDAVVRVPVQ